MAKLLKLLLCRECGTLDSATGNPRYDRPFRCVQCFTDAVDRLTEAIHNAPGVGVATLLYAEGMGALGMSAQDVRVDIALADLSTEIG